MQIDVAGWKFKKFQTHLRAHTKGDLEDWDSYEARIRGQFQNFNAQAQNKFFNNALAGYKRTQTTTSNIQIVNKPKLRSTAYIHNGNRWTEASHTDTKQAKRPTTNGHAEQRLYSTMLLPKKRKVWIGFVQNEWPCRNEGCCDYFRVVSRQSDIAGVIFTVQDSGGYARDHGREPGSSGNVYFFEGSMTYTPPAGAPAAP